MMPPTVAGQYGSEPSQPLAGNITRPSTTIEGQAHPPSSKAQPRAARGSRLVARACSPTARFLQAEQAQHVLTRCLLGTPELRNESRAVNPLPCGRAWVPPTPAEPAQSRAPSVRPPWILPRPSQPLTKARPTAPMTRSPAHRSWLFHAPQRHGPGAAQVWSQCARLPLPWLPYIQPHAGVHSMWPPY